MKCKKVGKKNANTDNMPIVIEEEIEELSEKPLRCPPSSN